MVFVKFNRKKLENRERELNELEEQLKKLGWKNLRWCPSNPLRNKNHSFNLIGCPPNYNGPYEDYYETAIITLAVPGAPHLDSNEILLREQLDRCYEFD